MKTIKLTKTEYEKLIQFGTAKDIDGKIIKYDVKVIYQISMPEVQL